MAKNEIIALDFDNSLMLYKLGDQEISRIDSWNDTSLHRVEKKPEPIDWRRMCEGPEDY